MEALFALQFAKLRANFVALSHVQFDSFPGSVIRGAFGRALRRVSCTGGSRNCAECMLGSICTYRLCFEPNSPQERDVPGGGYDSIPRPFVLDILSAKDDGFGPGDRFVVELTLMGRAIPTFPHFIAALFEMTRSRLGKGEGSVALVSVDSVDPVDGTVWPILAPESRTISGRPFVRTGYDLSALLGNVGTDVAAVEVEFQTPTRLKVEGRLCPQPEFEALVRALLRRITMLLRFHQEVEPAGVDYSGVLAKARAVQLADCEVRWLDQGRYSARQRTRMKLGGIVGRARYEGEVAPFLQLLKLGEQIHVGKGATFGLGRYVSRLRDG